MCQMNVLEAKTNFSKLLLLLETKQEKEIIICKNNTPVAKITPMPEIDRASFLGIAEGKWEIYDDEHFDDEDSEINGMFYGSSIEDF